MHILIEQALDFCYNKTIIYISSPLFLFAHLVTDFTTVNIQYGKRAGNKD